MARKTGSVDLPRGYPLDSRSRPRSIRGARRWGTDGDRGSARRDEVTPVPRCPNCGGRPDRTLAQYLRRSSLVRLKACASCDLVWADARFGAPSGMSGPGDGRPEEEADLSELERAPVRSHLAGLVCSRATPGSSVLQVGGGRGHLLSRVRDRRPDLCLVLQDPSSSACRYAESHFGLATLRGELDVLESLSRPFDVVVLDEVLSYVSDLRRTWRLLARMVADGGSLIVRIATRPSLIRLGAALERAAVRLGQSGTPETIPFLDPGQLYVLTPAFLDGRLRDLGFDSVRTVPAPAARVSEGWVREIQGMGFRAAGLLHRATRGRVSVTPSFTVIAERAG